MSRDTRHRCEHEEARRALIAFTVVAAATALLWFIDSWWLRIPVLTSLGKQTALSPIYAFFAPSALPGALFFPLAAAIVLWLLPRLADPDRTTPTAFGAYLLLLSVALPLLLFLVRQPISELGSLLTFYPGEEVYYDALRIRDLGAFYAHYVELIPRLSLHGQHFPPGHATWIFVVNRFFGPSVQAVAACTLLLFALGMLASCCFLRLVLDEARARQAALLCLACPSILDFACTSMDAVFYAAAALALWLAVRTLRSHRDWLGAIATGGALLVAVLLSYSALPLGLLISLYAVLRFARGDRNALPVLLAIGGSFAVLAVLLEAGSGFDVLDAFLVAREHNVALMTRVIGSDPVEVYAQVAYGNGAAFVIGSGAALFAVLGLRATSSWNAPFPVAVGAVFAVLVFGGIHQMETERIWLYALPWLAALALYGRPLSPALLRFALGVSLLQAWAMEILLFTLW